MRCFRWICATTIAYNHRKEEDHFTSNLVINEIQEYLKDQEPFDICPCGLPIPKKDLKPLKYQGLSYEDSTNEFCSEVEVSITDFNEKQRRVFEKVVGSVIRGVPPSNFARDIKFTRKYTEQTVSEIQESEKLGYVFLLDVPGGTGKTVVTRPIQRFL